MIKRFLKFYLPILVLAIFLLAIRDYAIFTDVYPNASIWDWLLGLLQRMCGT